MSWLRIDDELFLHPKWIATPPVARALWVTALSYAGKFATGGAIHSALLPMLGGSLEDADALVASGLWEKTEAGYQIHDFETYNASSTPAAKAQISEVRAEAGRRGGLRSGEARREAAQQSEASSKQISSKTKQNEAPEPEPVPVSQTTSERESLAVEIHGPDFEADIPPPPASESDFVPRRLPLPLGADRAALGSLLAAHRSVLYPELIPEEFALCELDAALPALRKLQQLRATPEKVAEATRRMLAEFGPERTFLSALPAHWTRFTAKRAAPPRSQSPTERRIAETEDRLRSASPAIVEATVRKWADRSGAIALEGACR